MVRCADGSTTDALFAPRLMFKNRLAREHEEEWYALRGWRPDNPEVKWYAHFAGKFHIPHASLRIFPFDEQMLTIELQTGWNLAKEAEDKLSGSVRFEGEWAKAEQLRNREYPEEAKAALEEVWR